MKILIVGGHSAHDPEITQMQAYADFFAQAARQTAPDSSAEFCFLDELAFWITNDEFVVTDTRRDVPVDSYDVVVLRGRMRPYIMLASALSHYASAKGLRFFNDYSLYRPSSKLSQTIAMHEQGVPLPATLACDHPEQLVAQAARRLTYPLIAKDTYGAHGDHNFLVHSEDELRDILRTHSTLSFVLQEFIPNDADYRILIIGNQQLIIRRQAVGDSHLNNTSRGATATLVNPQDFPAETLAYAQRFAHDLHLDIAGVDAIQHKETGEMFFLEVNSQPQLLTGAFVAEKARLMADFLAGKQGSSSPAV